MELLLRINIYEIRRVSIVCWFFWNRCNGFGSLICMLCNRAYIDLKYLSLNNEFFFKCMLGHSQQQQQICEDLDVFLKLQSVLNLWPCSQIHVFSGWGFWHWYIEATNISKSAVSWPGLCREHILFELHLE